MKKFKLILIAATIVTTIGITFLTNNLLNCDLNDKWCSNIEALAQIEGSIITCDSGSWGRCFEVIDSRPFTWECTWTGKPEDYCRQPW